MTTHRFETARPVRLVAEIGKGAVKVVATETAETVVEISGGGADEVRVQQEGDEISVIGPRERDGFFGRDIHVEVTITLPAGSQIGVRTGSADVKLVGSVGATQVRSGSGDIEVDAATGSLQLETGSGDIRVENAREGLTASSGSGDVVVMSSGAAVQISTGSGDVRVGTTGGAAVLKTGSGDIKVDDAGADVVLRTGSGDVAIARARRGRMTIEGASGDAYVGVPAGVPVWTDISTVTGRIQSNLRGAGQSKEGSDHVEIRARLVNGDIVLAEV